MLIWMVSEMPGLKNKVVAITGASGGIGTATATLLAERGAKVVLGAPSEDKLKPLAAGIIDAGGEALCVQIDVTKRADLARFVEASCNRFGKLDVIFNNAGIGPISPMDDLKVDEWDKMIDVNIKGVLYGIAAALPLFRKQGFGHVINTASTAGLKTVPNQAVYSGTKFAVRAISEGLRQEAGAKLRVTVITPGAIKTGFVDSITNDEVRATLAQARDSIAIPPEAIARAVAFAIEQSDDVDVGELVIRPTAQA
jgi:NADP-dependent 3-hydroxy acid dehydrogenase YdfG